MNATMWSFIIVITVNAGYTILLASVIDSAKDEIIATITKGNSHDPARD